MTTRALTENQAAVLREVRYFNLPPTITEIAEAMGLPRSTIESSVRRLTRRGALESLGVKRGGVTYRLPQH